MKWGIIGYGRIAGKFEESIKASVSDEIVAIASRSQFDNIPSTYRAYDNYTDILTDDNVEIIYVSTTHNSHKQNAIAALKAGKHVLCEKPMSTSQIDTTEICQAAKSSGRFLMEAIWSRFLPGYQSAMSKIKEGVIGEVELIQANFGFKMNPQAPKERLIDPSLAGGAVWDVGIYPISLAQDIYDSAPINVHALGVLNNQGVETRALMTLDYGNDRLAQLSCAFDMSMPNHAIIIGSKGRIVMRNFWMCEEYDVIIGDNSETIHAPFISTGLYHEILACGKYIKGGQVQSDLMSWQHSQELALIMDEVIRQCRIEEL